jgi:hypothetical protein
MECINQVKQEIADRKNETKAKLIAATSKSA